MLHTCYTAANFPKELRLVAVEWEEAPEPRTVVMNSATQTAQDQLLQLERQQQHQQEETTAKKTATQTRATWTIGKKRRTESAAEVDDYPPPTRPPDDMYDITVGQMCRKQIIIHPHPINPHTDIEPTGKFEVMVRPVLSYKEDDSGGSCITEDKACVYQPDGRCAHTLPADTAAQLY